MTGLFIRAYVALSVTILIWDVFLAGQIAGLRRAPRPLSALTALAGLFVAPAALILIASPSMLAGRAIHGVSWLWPATAVLFAAQAAYVTARRLVRPLIGTPIVIYNVMLAATAIARYMVSLGHAPPDAALALAAAQTAALGVVTGPAALYSPWAIQLPILSPAYPARWRLSKTFRVSFALFAGAWATLIGAELLRGAHAVASYRPYATEPLQERPAGDFAVGIKLFPDLEGPPPSLALRNDLALVDTTDVDAVMVVVAPEGARAPALDSLSRALEQFRRDSTIVIVGLGYSDDAGTLFRHGAGAYTAARLDDVERIARRVRPDYLLPADEPYGSGARAIGRQPPRYWMTYLASAAARVKRVNRRIRVGVTVSAFSTADSILYMWAAAPGSPIDVVGFRLFPSFAGASALNLRMNAADRWMRTASAARGARAKEHWVFAAGGYPLAHGEASQARAVWGALAWATSRASVKGLVVAEAGDYQRLIGLRGSDGHLRGATLSISRAVQGLRETARP